jgi:hypothetical protein
MAIVSESAQRRYSDGSRWRRFQGPDGGTVDVSCKCVAPRKPSAQFYCAGFRGANPISHVAHCPLGTYPPSKKRLSQNQEEPVKLKARCMAVV